VKRKTLHQDRNIIFCQKLSSSLIFVIDEVGFFTVQDDKGTVRARGRLDLAYRRY